MRKPWGGGTRKEAEVVHVLVLSDTIFIPQLSLQTKLDDHFCYLGPFPLFPQSQSQPLSRSVFLALMAVLSNGNQASLRIAIASPILCSVGQPSPSPRSIPQLTWAAGRQEAPPTPMKIWPCWEAPSLAPRCRFPLSETVHPATLPALLFHTGLTRLRIAPE